MDTDNTQQYSQAGVTALMQAAGLVEEMRTTREQAQKRLEDLDVSINKDIDELEAVMAETEKNIDALDEETVSRIDDTILDSLADESDEEQ